MKIAFAQFAPDFLEPAANREAAYALIEGHDVDLVVLPELFTSGYFFRTASDVGNVAEPIPGPTTERMVEWASDLNCTIVAGLPEQSKTGPYYNSAAVVDPTGFRGSYRKVHLFNEEKRWFEAGDLGFPVFDITTASGESYVLGVMICFDWYFPESARTLALRGADVIAHPSNLVLPHCPNSMPVRARENHVFTITANRYGAESKDGETLTFIGESSICAPNGSVLNRAPAEGDVVSIAEINPHDARERSINAYNDIFKDRRPDQYADAGLQQGHARASRTPEGI